MSAEITITKGEHGWTVAAGFAYTPNLCWDEMIGQVVHLTHPKIGDARYQMLTAEQHAERERSFAQRMEETHAAKRSEDGAKAAAITDLVDALRQWACAEQADDGVEFSNAQKARDLALDRATTVGLA